MKTILVLLAATLASASGDAFMSRGMKQLGDVSAGGGAFWKMPAMFGNPSVWGAILCYAAFFFLYSAALSWSKLSLAQPLTALTFVFAALIARFVLGESLSPWRWAGVVVIMAGVVLVSLEAPGQLK